MTSEIQIFLRVLRKMKKSLFSQTLSVITKSATVVGWTHIWTKILVKILLQQMRMIPTVKATILAYPTLTSAPASIITFDWLPTINRGHFTSLKQVMADLDVTAIFVAKKDATKTHSKTLSTRHLITDHGYSRQLIFAVARVISKYLFIYTHVDCRCISPQL